VTGTRGGELGVTLLESISAKAGLNETRFRDRVIENKRIVTNNAFFMAKPPYFEFLVLS
jgi:hypothetical protein